MLKYKNKIKCKNCGDIIESKTRHDFQQCNCKSVYTDGGLDYQRVGWPDGDMNDWIEFIKEEVELY